VRYLRCPEQCCETTARVAFDLGYHVTFVTEATATSPIAQHDAPTGQTAGQQLADPRTPPASMPGEMRGSRSPPRKRRSHGWPGRDYPT
jgi:hypothetical protein